MAKESSKHGALMDLGEILKRDKDLLMERWLSRAEEELPEADRSWREELIDGLGDFLRAAGESLQVDPGTPGEGARASARTHGVHRWRSNWRLESVIRDYQILRPVVVEHVAATSGCPGSAAELAGFHQHLDQAICDSLSTYVKHLDAELAEAHRRLRQLVLTVGHEIRNPIGASLHALHLIEDGDLPQDARRTAAGILSRQLDLLVRVSEDLSTLSHLWMGRLHVERVRTDLRRVLEESVEAVRARFEGKSLSLATWLPMEPIWILGDSIRLRQVFTNILTNAVRFTPSGGRIETSIETRPDEVVVRVVDDGAGISRDFLPHVFDLFSQAESNRGGGVGMGLHLARHIVEAHEGRIEAESEGEGKGAEFRVALPLAGNPAAVLGAADETGASRAEPGVVLVVDDDEDWVELLRTLLESRGHQVAWASTGEAALEAIRQHRPRVAIVDLLLPGTTGFELAPRLRDLAPEMKLVAYSGLVEEGLIDRARAAGFDLVLPKTIHVEELLAVL